MVGCWVPGCPNKIDSSTKSKFFSIPNVRHHEGEFNKTLSVERRRQWLANINRKDEPTKNSRICSEHFITGRPACIYERFNPDWAPTLMLGRIVTPTISKLPEIKSEETEQSIGNVVKIPAAKKQHLSASARLELPDKLQLKTEDSISPESVADTSTDNNPKCSISQDSESQADREVQRLLAENMKLQAELDSFKLTQDSFRGNNEKVTYYTGLPNFETLMLLFNAVSPFLCENNVCMGVFERLLMTLMKLKLNLPFEDLAYRFNASIFIVSKIFLITIRILHARLGFLIHWPKEEELQKMMPREFQTYFAKRTVVIIDCFEICIQKPEGLLPRALTLSRYEHHNTVKYLIGLTPQGSISFISNGWEGRASYKLIAEQCGILNKLEPGDIVLAGRGSDSVDLYCAKIKVPAYMHEKPLLSTTDKVTTRKVTNVRAHVDRVIGLVPKKYTILQGTLPADYLISENDDVPIIDKITTVCCALTNMCESVVVFY